VSFIFAPLNTIALLSGGTIAFYLRKVKFTEQTFSEKLGAILESFPRLQDIHPFHSALMNTLYDADHFRIALGQLSTAKHLIEQVARDYVRLIKYAQSLDRDVVLACVQYL
jgi:nucleolar GTP-binding protein